MSHEEIVRKIREATKIHKEIEAITSWDDATLLLKKFQSEGTLLSVLFFTRDQTMHLFLKARVEGFDGDEFLTLVAGSRDFCFISLKGCRYEYTDERLAPEWLRNTDRVEETLTIVFPSNESLTLRALVNEAASGQ